MRGKEKGEEKGRGGRRGGGGSMLRGLRINFTCLSILPKDASEYIVKCYVNH